MYANINLQFLGIFKHGTDQERYVLIQHEFIKSILLTCYYFLLDTQTVLLCDSGDVSQSIQSLAAAYHHRGPTFASGWAEAIGPWSTLVTASANHVGPAATLAPPHVTQRAGRALGVAVTG